MVTNTSNSFTARVSNSPFFIPDQPRSGTVTISMSVENRPFKRRGKFSSSSTRMAQFLHHGRLAQGQKSNCLLARYAGEVCQEGLQRFSCLQVINQCVYRHACPGKHRHAAQ